jgi:secreted protein with Ig-like and vWFA domain
MSAGLPPQPPRETPEEQKFLAIASGLCVGDSTVDVPRNMLLIDWMKGLFGEAERCKDVVRLVICGVSPYVSSLETLHCNLQ